MTLRTVRLLAATLLFLSACARPAAGIAPPSRPELALEKATLRVYRNSDPQLFARASHLELMRSTNQLTARDVHFDFLADAVALDAASLQGNLGSQSFELEGGLHLATADGGLTGHTPRAHFEGKEGARGVVTGSDPVLVHGVGDGRPYALTADRFRFDVDQQHATFEPVTTKVGAQP